MNLPDLTSLRMWAAMLTAHLIFSGCASKLPPLRLDASNNTQVFDARGFSQPRPIPKDDILRHSLNFDEEGEPIEPNALFEISTSSDPTKEQYDYNGQLDKVFENMHKYFKEPNHRPDKKILLFVHGGLNSTESAISRLVSPTLDENGSRKPLYEIIKEGGQYPVFVNWETGPVSSYLDHLVAVRQGEKTNKVFGYISSPVVLGTDIARSIFRAPLVWSKMFINNWLPWLDKRADRLLDRQIAYIEADYLTCLAQTRSSEDHEARKICNKCQDAYLQQKSPEGYPDCNLKSFMPMSTWRTNYLLDSTQQKMDKEKADQTTKSSEENDIDAKLGTMKSSMGLLSNAAIYNSTIPFKLLTSPIIDTFGTSSWNNMLRRVNLLYHDDGEFDKASQDLPDLNSGSHSPCTRTKNPKPGGGLGIFFHRLNCEIRDADKNFAEELLKKLKADRLIKIAKKIMDMERNERDALFNVRSLTEKHLKEESGWAGFIEQLNKLTSKQTESKDSTLIDKANKISLGKGEREALLKIRSLTEEHLKGESDWAGFIEQLNKLTSQQTESLETLFQTLADECENTETNDTCQLIKNYQNYRLKPWKITLVGHSMGTIVLNEAIRRNPFLPIKNIVYMAAASTIRDYESSVIPYLRRNNETHFYNLMLHPYAEREETYLDQFFVGELIPRGSLLVMIDNYFSNPLTIYDRTLGRYDNYLLYTHHVPDKPDGIKGKIHIRSFSAGEDKEPQKHGDFTSNFRFWKENCWEDIKTHCYDPALMNPELEKSKDENSQ